MSFSFVWWCTLLPYSYQILPLRCSFYHCFKSWCCFNLPWGLLQFFNIAHSLTLLLLLLYILLYVLSMFQSFGVYSFDTPSFLRCWSILSIWLNFTTQAIPLYTYWQYLSSWCKSSLIGKYFSYISRGR